MPVAHLHKLRLRHIADTLDSLVTSLIETASGRQIQRERHGSLDGKQSVSLSCADLMYRSDQSLRVRVQRSRINILDRRDLNDLTES